MAVKRLNEIDFLRGLAVLLVLFRHKYITAILSRIGWCGVDLFFVLSGFLVSGLLFKEYQKHGKIDVKRFFIRRGMKIYPLFYLLILITLLLAAFGIYNQWFTVNIVNSLSELFFIQNYTGKLWNHTWSLAVEEHFYLLLAGVAILANQIKFSNKHLIYVLLTILIACPILRVGIYYFQPTYYDPFYTHLRIDSLTIGVLLSYFYHYHPKTLADFYSKFNFLVPILLLVLLALVVLFPFENNKIYTLGFTAIYLGFSALLLYFLFSAAKIKQMLITSKFGQLVVHIGYYSYAIYLVHMPIERYILQNLPLENHYIIGFIIYFLLSIGLGTMISKFVELKIIKYRDRLYPTT